MSSIELEAEVVDPLYVADRFYRRVTSKLTLIPWDSPSDSYLQIEPITEELTCEKSQRVTIRYTAKKGDTIQFYHQVLSRGRIVQQGSHQRTFYFNEDAFEDDSTKIFSDTVVGNSVSLSNVGEFVLSFIPKATMSPIARLLVFYVRENGEIIADSKMFRIQKCLMNKVRLNFRHKQQYPSTEATMLLSASPFSICGIGLVDKSIQLLSKDTKFNKEKLFQWMESHDVSSDTEPRRSRKHRCNPYPLPQQRRGSFSAWRMDYELDGFPEFYFNEDRADSVNAFENAGIVVLTDLKLETRKCTLRDPFPHGISRHPYITAKSRSFDQLHHEAHFIPQRLSIPTTKVPDELDIQEIPESTPKSTEEIRSYFPETWLWEIQKIDSSGETAMKRQLPHTITEWIGEAVCINSKNGLGFSEKSSITAFQPFFVSLQLPYSVIRDETVPIIVSVFNYLTECLPIKISLEPSEDFHLTSESSSHKMCVCGGKSETHHFKLRPISLGQVNITVYGFSVEGDDEICGNEVTARLSARDAITKQLLVEAEGFPKEEVFNYFICPEATNGSYSSEVDLLLPENVVDGSARAYVSVSSDLMAQALNGLKSLVKLPVGCGEQNMVLFAPNIFVLDYLSATGKITEDLKEDCLNNMRKGYQRELQYRRNDGSYSAFGKSDRQGSLWLTAFVLKSFGQARRFMDIDENDLLISSQWILNRQFENGCFEPSGRILHKDMKGGLNQGEQSLAPLTAYILISLLESGAESLNHTAAKNALKCLAADGIPNNYALALYAYATALSREIDTAKQHLKLLDERAVIKDGNKFWETSHKSKSVSVEIAGYYVLALLEVNEQNSIPTSLPVVKWIAQQRNSNGGFVSTQDTIVALQALAKYSALTSQISVDIGLVIQSDELVRGFKLDENNRLVSQRAKLPVLPTVAEIQAVGNGCALVQFSLRYNVKNCSGSEAFDLDVKVVRQGSSSGNTPRIEICMRYKATDETSNMVVVAVKMASGFVPSEWSLDVLQSDQTIRLKRYEVQGNLVNLYFNELTNKLKCFSFNIKNEIDVQDVKPATVKLYDYYQPELEVTKEYVIPPDCVAPNLPELPELLTSTLAEELLPTFDDELLSTLGSTSLPDEPDTGITNVFSNSTVIPHIIQIVDKSAHAEELSDDAKHQSAHAEELSDDASSFQTIENANHLANFVDLTDDPDFPDGIEGNLPISILPPIQSISELNDETAVLDCPVCMNKFPANFTDIYCTSAFALRANVRSGNAKVVKILQDVSYYLQQPQPVKKFAEVKWDERCSCRQLTGGENTIIITGTPITLWSSEKKKHQIHLTSQAHVISSAGKTVQPKELKEARKSCEGDP
ncbi:LOW QUALITY PROTEIN: alpha-2-macroglobulin-like [Stegodyphus dumicola]|uniref:LOW QUALITY PROTEIN: alpha-2-macroglobulin-like n=1 Tax=Stegodyphus dumicola TaxID=202533 RepID=UPI0015AE022C|nr:LOW QUALITY PROTEIN: alpha-2-macroglobulin-like [Stegodyphus dumicola]